MELKKILKLFLLQLKYLVQIYHFLQFANHTCLTLKLILDANVFNINVERMVDLVSLELFKQ